MNRLLDNVEFEFFHIQRGHDEFQFFDFGDHYEIIIEKSRSFKKCSIYDFRSQHFSSHLTLDYLRSDR